MKGIRCNTHYRQLQIVRKEFLERSETPQQKIVPLSIVTERFEVSALNKMKTVSNNLSEPQSEKDFIRKKGIDIEIPKNTEENALIALLRGLQQC